MNVGRGEGHKKEALLFIFVKILRLGQKTQKNSIHSIFLFPDGFISGFFVA
jgi:hypothetical protein